MALAVAACVDSGPGPASPSQRLYVGESTVCALDRKAELSCWGRNTEYLEYGLSVSVPDKSAEPVPIGRRVASLGGGVSNHACGLLSNGDALCWGRGGVGQLGNGAAGATGNTPVTVYSPQPWTDIRVGRLITCGLVANGDAYCWGLNQRGELGDDALPTGARSTPNKVVGDLKFSSVSPGWTHVCGISTAGAAYCWGANDSGQLGIGTADSDNHGRPLLVATTAQFRKLSLSARSTCGLTVDNRILCWGYNGVGQLGDGTTTQRNVPTPIASDLKFTDVAVGSGFGGAPSPGLVLPTGAAQGGVAHACAVSEAANVFCWGWNGNSQAGDFYNSVVLTPTLVTGLSRATGVALGGAYSCATTETMIACWGYNYYGQLGNGTYNDSPVPLPVNYAWP